MNGICSHNRKGRGIKFLSGITIGDFTNLQSRWNCIPYRQRRALKEEEEEGASLEKEKSAPRHQRTKKSIGLLNAAAGAAGGRGMGGFGAGGAVGGRGFSGVA
ncbi:uncharacterized protein A4U43_C01F19470 [Asparagus officinalis]|uniref:Uncharacterized protein n=1 Tax=Asparagus officinalis TaxID=4686 RepID=A0A5P1FRF2_ASPOF|nr:uncharacterized protein A4U43_C01F19470 [Asparagus officinalis]